MGLLLRSLTTLIASFALTFSAVSYSEKPKWANKIDASIVEFAVGASGEPFDFDDNGGDFDILVAALIATGVVEAFDGTDLTVFAPNDNAFYMLTGTDNDTDAFNAVLSLLSEEEIAAVLTYHVTPDVRNSRSVTRAKTITMLDGNTISFEGGLIIATNSEAGLLDIDNRLSDGMVHVIDTVLLP
ncbi:COG2335 Secreted and surface protein containing fasciclin-like repeats [Vibrio sp. B1FIG11]|uniref:fasciclin domain-containing protein n=1 Tax=Vibrio sp. B1FIG11 TaxID=2751177 RepID=UPI0015F68E5F|nr:fasciclin domain-containing protein [Vibrio sp. B1FIG11]CAE6934318.1 COG2335 Secreted and surface protein containing fasciclin-like repeats [Vibrio sp. B1FIG11]